jgi:glutathionylspermidine amidase/synthetase
MNKIILLQILPLVKNDYKIIGITNNTVVFSNKNITKQKLNYINGIFTGLRWQCVEFARRYLIINYGITFNQIANAHEIFKLTNFENLLTNSKIQPIYKHLNGCKILPKVGSLLVWNDLIDKNATGHVAIITKISIPNYIEVCEQNWHTDKLNRRIKILYTNRFYILDKHLIGWINY